MKEVLKIFLWGMEIGRLAWHEGRHLSYFNYNPKFLRGNLDVAPLTASIHNPLSTRAIFGEAERIYQKLPLSSPTRFPMPGATNSLTSGAKRTTFLKEA